MARPEDLIGTWRMRAWTRESASTGETSDCLGPDPIGYISYHADGRMMATVFRRDRPAPPAGRPRTEGEKAELFDTMLAYVGAYSLSESEVTHHVEAAWAPDWEIDLSRPFQLERHRLTIEAPGDDPITGESIVQRMVFEKV
ncbi:MAG: lipocalin-like domain-containing protein [Pseudomonadota bacterium]